MLIDLDLDVVPLRYNLSEFCNKTEDKGSGGCIGSFLDVLFSPCETQQGATLLMTASMRWGRWRPLRGRNMTACLCDGTYGTAERGTSGSR